MKLIHHIIVDDSEVELIQGLKNLGFPYEPKEISRFAHYIIDLTDPRYEASKRLIDEFNAYGVIDTRFTTEDIIEAEWNRFWILHEWGYPQPEDGFKFQEITYEGICLKCGTGYKQVKPFRIRGKPRMGRNPFFSLYWSKTYFCVPEVLETLKQNGITGYEARDAINHSTGEPLSKVSQLVFPAITEPGLDERDKARPETCPECGRTKYEYHRQGMMKYRRAALKDIDIQQSFEWFGSGRADAYREVLVSNRLSRLIIEQGWRGIALRPVELV